MLSNGLIGYEGMRIKPDKISDRRKQSQLIINIDLILLSRQRKGGNENESIFKKEK